MRVCKGFPTYTIPFSPPSLLEIQHKRAGIAQTRSSLPMRPVRPRERLRLTTVVLTLVYSTPLILSRALVRYPLKTNLRRTHVRNEFMKTCYNMSSFTSSVTKCSATSRQCHIFANLSSQTRSSMATDDLGLVPIRRRLMSSDEAKT